MADTNLEVPKVRNGSGVASNNSRSRPSSAHSHISDRVKHEELQDINQEFQKLNAIGEVAETENCCQKIMKKLPCRAIFSKEKKEMIKSWTFEEHKEATGKTTEYDVRSLWILHGSWFIRRKLVWLIEWKPFENFITLVILANSVMLACTDYNERLYGQDYISIQNLNMAKVDDAFSIIFLFECVFKVLAMGFILHKNSYMRDRWNWLDIFVVTISVVTWLPGIEGNSSMKSLRTFRILRPLRSINSLPSMKALIQSLLSSIPGMVNVFIFLAFIFTIFAIFGTHQFLGSQYNRCRMTEEPIGLNTADVKWDINFDAEWLCSTDSDCKRMLGDGEGIVHKCGNLAMYGIDIAVDKPQEQELISFDIVNFNNVGLSLLTIFQSLTLEGWVLLMYNYMDSNDYWISVIYFCFMVIFGSFFAMQLVLAQIMESFNKDRELKEQEEIKEEDNEIKKKGFKDLFFGAAKKADDQDSASQEENRENSVDKGNQDEVIPSVAAARGNEVRIANNAEITHVANKQVRTPEVKEQPQLNISEQDFNDEELDEFQNKQKFPGDGDDLDSDEEFEDETQYEIAARDRSKKNKLFLKTYELVNNPFYNFVVFLLILANTVCLALDDYPQSLAKEKVLSALNDFFTWAFFVEMVIKMVGLGINNYVHDKFNLFDAVVVTLSLIDWFLTIVLTAEQKQSVGSSMQALRALRLLRVIKLARSWTKLQDIIGKTVMSLKDISNFGVLLFLFMYIFALLGMEMFANQIRLTWDEEIIEDIPAYYKAEGIMIAPRYNFDNIYNALVVVFCAILGEDWNNSMYSFITPGIADHYVVVFFFLCLLILGNIMLLSLFTAILLQNFDASDEEKEAMKSKPKSNFSIRKVFTKSFLISVKNFLVGIFETRSKKKKQQKLPQEDNKDKQTKNTPSARQSGIPSKILGENEAKDDINRQQPLLHYQFGEGAHNQSLRKSKTVKGGLGKSTTIVIKPTKELHHYSCYVFSPKSEFRIACSIISGHNYFEAFIITLILISTVCLALQTPLDDPQSQLTIWLTYIDYVFTGFFICEMFTKIFAFGFAFCGKESYIRNSWNILDFVIVLSATISVIFSNVDIGFLKSLRVMRVLRPLRLLSRHRGLKLAISALFNSLPQIGNLLLIVVFFIFMLAILCTTLFAGQFWYCEVEHLNMNDYMIKNGIVTRYDCLMYGGEWVNPDFQFDNTAASLLTLLSIQSTEGWVDTMWQMIDVQGQELAPVRDAKRYYCIFAIACTGLMTLLFLNLFVGVVIESFNLEKEQLSLNALLKKVEQTWIETLQLCYSAKPKITTPLTEAQKFRNFMIELSNGAKFDNFILLCILGNTFSLTLKWYGQSKEFEKQLETVNLIFAIIFTLEAVIKIYAYRRNYFREAWNKFDFSVVVLTWVVMIILQFDFPFDVSILGMIARTLRIGRVFRLSKRVQAIQVILMTLLEAIPSISALGILLGLLFFLYSIIGMSQFAFTKLGGELNYHVNFQSFINGVLLLMRNATGEAWDTIMYDYSRMPSILYQCEEGFDYYSWLNNDKEMNGCGNQFISIFFFYSFNIIVSQIFLNLFIAIIIDSFMNQSSAFNMPVNQQDIDDFIDVWQQYDPNGNGLIPCDQLEEFVVNLSKRNQCKLIPNKKRMLKSSAYRRKYIATLEIPSHEKFSYFIFVDVLQQMSRIVVEAQYIKESIREQREKSVNQLKLGNEIGQENYDQAIRDVTNNPKPQGEVVRTDPKQDFKDAINGISMLNKEIASVAEIIKTANQMAKKGFKNIDVKMEQDENTVKEIYSSKHYIYGELIVKYWRVFVEENAQDLISEKEK